MRKLILILLVTIITQGCGIYSFTGIGDINANSFQVNFFQNNAPIIEPGIDRRFTLALQDLIQNQTNLELTNTNGDLVYEGEISNYTIAPMTATAQQTAAQNRLTITINVRFFNKNKEEDDFEKSFSFYHDYGATQQLTGSVLETALDDIFERITQDIFNESLAKW
ncbi:LPS assembly lipoprotein LptE [Pseudofulvibacter geojedonensis]|uniref:LPS assembly lipoprotein LptE n=1 Tax=Pseudofulvibacter geojedonensis TaxID=1123758 RepID=A0ABW3I3B9_9FLAO